MSILGGERMAYDYRYRPTTFWPQDDDSQEVTIATVSCFADRVHVTARRKRGGIRYVITDDRENPGHCAVKTSTKPLTFWRFLRLLNESDSGLNDEFIGGLILESANYHAVWGSSDRQSYAGLAGVYSDFYPQLSEWTADLWASWSLGATWYDDLPQDECMQRVPVVDGVWEPEIAR